MQVNLFLIFLDSKPGEKCDKEIPYNIAAGGTYQDG